MLVSKFKYFIVLCLLIVSFLGILHCKTKKEIIIKQNINVISPDTLTAIIIKGTYEKNIGDFINAKQTLKSGKLSFPKSAILDFSLADLYLKLNNTDSSLYYLNSAITLDKNNISYLDKIISVYYEKMDYNNCIKFCLKSLSINKNNQNVYRILINSTIFSNQLSYASNFLADYKHLFGEDYYYLINKYKTIQTDKQKFLKLAISISENSEYFYNELITLFLKQSQLDSAVFYLNKSQKLSINNSNAYQMVLIEFLKNKKDNLFQTYSKSYINNISISYPEKTKLFVKIDSLQPNVISLNNKQIIIDSLNYLFNTVYSTNHKSYKLSKETILIKNTKIFSRLKQSEMKAFITEIFNNSDFQNCIIYSDSALQLYPENPEFYYYKGLSLKALNKIENSNIILIDGLNLVVENNQLEFNFCYNIALNYQVLKSNSEIEKYFLQAASKNEKLNSNFVNEFYQILILNYSNNVYLQSITNFNSRDFVNRNLLICLFYVSIKKYEEAKYICNLLIGLDNSNLSIVYEILGDIEYFTKHPENAKIKWLKSQNLGNRKDRVKFKLQNNFSNENFKYEEL